MMHVRNPMEKVQYLSPSRLRILSQGTEFSTIEKDEPILSVKVDQVPSETRKIQQENFFLSSKFIYGVMWIAFNIYAYILSPGGSDISAARDLEIIQNMVTKPFDATYSPYFTSLFNGFVVLLGAYSSLLLPGSKGQKVPTIPFLAVGFVLGFGGLGPYLGLREKRRNITQKEQGFGSRIFENKITPLLLLGFTLALLNFAITSEFNGDRVQSFIELFQTQRLVHVSTIDFTILSLVMCDPISEDMRLRGWAVDDKKPIASAAVAFSLVPLIGPLLYLILRPRLPPGWSPSDILRQRR